MASKPRLPAVPTRPMKPLAKVLENAHVHRLLGLPVRAALRLRHLAGGDEVQIPAEPPLPTEVARTDNKVAAAELLAQLRMPDPAAAGPSLFDYARAYASGSTTPTAVAEAFLAAVRDSERGAPMRFFVALDEDDVRAQAAESARRHREGRALSVLDGVLVPVKDEVDLRGYRTMFGTKMPGRAPVTRDCAAVARLRALGAVLVGKANMHELGAGPTGLNAAWGTCRNPWDPARFPGGSSSGSAALVAAGLSPLAVGCDGGGSIRIPASFCGVVGLKPTFGRVPKQGETPPLAHSVTHVGPIGRTTRDVVAGYAAFAGPEDDERGTHAQPKVAIAGWDETRLSDLTLGLVREWWQAADPEVARACERTLAVLQARGARVVEVDIRGLGRVREAMVTTVGAEVQGNAFLGHAPSVSALAPDIRVGLALARFLGPREYGAAQKARAEVAAAVWKVLESAHALVAPATLLTAPKIPRGPHVADLAQFERTVRTTALANLTGQPAISFPAGFDRQGLPVGFQAYGRPYDEVTLFRLAAAAETELEPRFPRRWWRLLP